MLRRAIGWFVGRPARHEELGSSALRTKLPHQPGAISSAVLGFANLTRPAAVSS